MNAEIISVKSNNSSSQFIKHELASFGISLTHFTSADGELSRLRETIRIALGRNELVVIIYDLKNIKCCPVLKAVSDVLAAPLELNNDSLERIHEFFKNTNSELPDDNEKQAMLPRGCTVFPNDHGYAPGCAVSRYGQDILILPGELSEIMPMFSDYVAPYLTILTDGTIVSRTVGVFGLSEAVLTERLADLLSEANPAVSSYAKDGEAILRVTARAADRSSAYALCDPVVEEIRQRLGVNVYGVDVGSLQKAVVAHLLDKKMKIATAESCTAGMLSSRLTEVTGVSAVFECGISAYSPEIKNSVLGVPLDMIEKFGTVSPEVAGAMATGARQVGKASLGISITGVAGPDTSEGKPVGTVYIALADEKRIWVKKIEAESIEGDINRETVRKLATSHALDLVRRYLEALPTVMAGGEIIQPAEPDIPDIPHSSVKVEKQSILCRILPWKGDRKTDVLRKSAFFISCLLLFTALASIVYMQVMQPLQNERMFKNLADLYSLSADMVSIEANTNYPEGMLTQFYALYSRNPDVRGWVKIDGTNINYPVMQDIGNSYYSNHNFNGELSNYGVPYFSKNTALYSPYSINRSILIYGNNNRDGQMFSDLAHYYNNIDFLVKHPVIEMNTIFSNAKWKIFSVMVLTDPETGQNAFDYTRSVFIDEADFLDFAGQLRTRSLYNMPLGQADVQEGDSILMLSTNFENTAGYQGARLVVAARKVRDGEPEKSDLSGLKFNSNVIMPSEWKGSASPNITRRNTTKTLNRSYSEVLTATTDPTIPTSEDIASSTQGAEDSSTGSLASTTTTNVKSTGTITGNPTENNTSSKAETTTSTPTTTSTQTSPPSSAPPILVGLTKESEFLKNCKVKSGSELIEPKNKSELQHLLARVVKTELGSARTMGNNLAAQKAQAIASYTYILYYNINNKNPYPISLKTINLNDTTDKKIYDAVGEVVGIKILSNNQPVFAAYSASTPGYTSSNHEVYEKGQNLGHLQSVESAYENDSTMPEVANWKTTFKISMNDLKSKLESKYNATIYFDSGQTPFFVRSYDKNGQYALQTNAYYLSGSSKVYLKGHQIRMAVGSTLIRSHAFKVVSSNETDLVLSVKGYGHGLGLSQWGAANYAEYAGWDYRQILSHYYSITGWSKHRLVAPVW
jgi:SrtB family sortase